MKWMSYKEMLPIGTGLIIVSAAFGLGAIYGNLPYDYETLWNPASDLKTFDDSFDHYLKWANAPAKVHHVMHFFMGLGLLGTMIKIYKPSEDTKYFEYGTLALLMVSIIIYLTNMRTGINSCFYNDFGEVNRETGINVMSASQFMAALILVGIIVLQGGLYFAEWYDNQLKLEFFEKNPDYIEVNGMAVKKDDVEKIEETPAATSASTSATPASTTVEKGKKKKSKKKD